jgi:hypothetical protein
MTDTLPSPRPALRIARDAPLGEVARAYDAAIYAAQLLGQSALQMRLQREWESISHEEFDRSHPPGWDLEDIL